MAEISKRTKGWCLTLNNYSNSEYDSLLGTECIYIILGKEVGESGTPHLQGYIYFKSEKSLSQCQSLNGHAHWENTRGSPDDNYTYCSKENNFEERGVRPMSKKRKGEIGGQKELDRWDDAKSKAIKGDLDSIPSDIYLRLYRTLKEVAKDHMAEPPEAADTTGIWICGPTGCGKTRSTRLDYPGAYEKMANKWWDGYQHQDAVVIQDLDPNHSCLGHHLKIWADRYPFLAETKGGALNIRPKHLVVTSQYRIEDIWSDDATRDALRRRFMVKDMFTLPYVVPKSNPSNIHN